MNKILPIYLFLGILISMPFNQLNGQNTNGITELLKFQDEITTDYLRHHLSALAADSMQGRETGQPGLDMAARYLARQYENLGLVPVGDDNSYYQHFDLVANKPDSTVYLLYQNDSEGNQKLVDRSVASEQSAAKLMRVFGGYGEQNAEIVFAGFGINDPTNDVAHLNGVDLKDKWVMVFQEIPNIVDDDTLIDPRLNFRTRFAQVLNERDAAGILLIPSLTPEEFESNAAQQKSFYTGLSGMSLKYRSNGGTPGGFSKGYNLIHPELAAEILSLENGIEGIKALRKDIIAEITNFTPVTTGYSLHHKPFSSGKTIESKNIAALIEGHDPELKDEVVVLTSHYDHVGIGQPDSTGDSIYNGADDDGSGTVALLNIAHALKEAERKGLAPRRSILILHVSAEEKGLLGSRYYSDHPIIPMDKTIANINIDMIGRIDAEHEEKGITDYSYIIGSDIISSDLDSMVQVANRASGNIELNKKYNDLSDPNQFYRRSDHWNFGRLGVPFVFFFTGVHEDYHRPSDEIEKIRFEKMATIVKTIYASTITIANTDRAPAVDNQEFIEITNN